MKERWIPTNFLALPEEQSTLDEARVVVLPVPYDSTTSFRSGARDGPRAIIEASYNLEDYDHELDADVAEVGIYTAPMLEPHMDGPRHMIERVENAVRAFASQGKLVGTLGGEHSLSIGAVTALAEQYPDMSVLFLDAHTDMRDEYMGTPWGHASVARRIYEICPQIQVGVRSVSLEEMEFIRSKGIQSIFWDEPWATTSHGTLLETRGLGEAPETTTDGNIGALAQQVLQFLSPHVYVSIDLDVLDPSIMSAVGTPEPDGMRWHEVVSLLRTVAERRRIVAFDIMELSPREGPAACAYIAAKLAYKLIAYATLLGTADKTSASVVHGLPQRT